jgi:PelA/Pel-15E family pectate lyase
LKAAREAGLALAYGQLKSGGWSQTIDFDPNGAKAGLYRNGRGNPKGRNHTSLDDNQTQSAVAFLAELDRALEFKDAVIADAVRYALEALLKAQFPNGAFPQGFTGPVAAHPIRKASFPVDWPRAWPNEAYWNYYTLNDGLAGSISTTLLTVIEVYQDSRYTDALGRLGDFLLLAQMPEPQPAWCQQYNFAMQPVWARKFEPPAICGLESEDAIRTLMKIFRQTGDRKYLAPIPRALAYLKGHVLPEGLMPRYFELKTDRALYMNRKGQEYFLTYDDTHLPAHYGWKQKTALNELAAEFGAIEGGPPSPSTPSALTRDQLESRVRDIVQALDEEGRWVSTYAGERLVGQPKFERGFRYLDSSVFARNVELLSQYLQ